MIGILAVNAIDAARCATKGITGVLVTISSIFAPTVANQSLIYGTAVFVRSAERQSTHLAMTAFASTVDREKS